MSGITALCPKEDCNMAQSITVSNFYPIKDLTAWPDLFAKLEYAKGGNVATHPSVLEFNVTNGGYSDKGIWKLEHVIIDGVKGIKASMDGEEKLNDPLHGLRSAEDLVEMLLTLHEVNGRQRMQADIKTGGDGYPDMKDWTIGVAGYNNHFQVHDPLTWLETTGKLKQWGDIEKDKVVTIKTSAEGLTTGVYTLTLIEEPDFLGLAVDLDGGPTFNYPRPHLRSAEEIVDVIIKLYGMYSQGVRPRDFQYNFKDGSIVVASAKSGNTEVKLFENGLITIQSSDLLSISPTAAEALVVGLGELVDKALEQE